MLMLLQNSIDPICLIANKGFANIEVFDLEKR